MQELIQYINALSKEERAVFARRCRTTVGYMRKAASTGQSMHAKTCVLIERESGGKVTRRHMCPDDWPDIWPELANSDENPAAATAQQAQADINSAEQGVVHG